MDKKKPHVEFDNSETIILNSDMSDLKDTSGNTTVNVKLWQEVSSNPASQLVDTVIKRLLILVLFAGGREASGQLSNQYSQLQQLDTLEQRAKGWSFAQEIKQARHSARSLSAMLAEYFRCYFIRAFILDSWYFRYLWVHLYRCSVLSNRKLHFFVCYLN